MAYLCQCDFGFRRNLLSQTSTARQMEKKNEKENLSFVGKLRKIISHLCENLTINKNIYSIRFSRIVNARQIE